MKIYCHSNNLVMKRTYKIKPVPKPRMTQSDKWKQRPCVIRYRQFCDEVRSAGVELPESGAVVSFILPMPKSWSKKKRAKFNGTAHQTKPDLDNLLKALSDAIHDEDCRIWHYGEIKKCWGETGYIIIERKNSNEKKINEP